MEVQGKIYALVASVRGDDKGLKIIEVIFSLSNFINFKAHNTSYLYENLDYVDGLSYSINSFKRGSCCKTCMV